MSRGRCPYFEYSIILQIKKSVEESRVIHRTIDEIKCKLERLLMKNERTKGVKKKTKKRFRTCCRPWQKRKRKKERKIVNILSARWTLNEHHHRIK